ncbi:MAG: twin-arginine translocase TatA/TatE family subunit [Flavobacteriaceae bacterium]|jgi:sec-independent protein translocase protein TatA|nr:twin-arginine translocase TatA/TatE family subunit [Flavobacteriaceae bacterium]OUX31693.1 MAG: twin-arginine translocase TatA/TatE family subunit [Pelagibacteraceae bacterium TMED258]|tara:strand:- start:235 stop:420 length:186 start_codon:yes stop_codon:yes gene_type:complete
MNLYIIPLALGPGQLVLIAVVVLILFGGGRKISELMRGTGKGIREFKKALKEDEEDSEKED